MTDIAKYRRTSNRIMVGPGSADRLTAKVLPAVLFERTYDPFNWNTVIFRMNHGIINGTEDRVLAEGTGTETHTLVAHGWTLGTSASDNDNCIITMDPADSSMGVPGYWNTDKEPWMMARVQTGVQDATALLNSEYVVGFDDQNTSASSDATASGEANAFRWQLTVGAALGANWICESSVASIDSRFDTGVAAQRATFVDLAVLLSKARKPHYFIGGNLVHVGPSMPANDELDAKLIVQAATTDAKSFGIQFWALGQRHVARA